ncbi:hypothetical protein SBADM41S_03642 [Streptomyces badius]
MGLVPLLPAGGSGARPRRCSERRSWPASGRPGHGCRPDHRALQGPHGLPHGRCVPEHARPECALGGRHPDRLRDDDEQGQGDDQQRRGRSPGRATAHRARRGRRRREALRVRPRRRPGRRRGQVHGDPPSSPGVSARTSRSPSPSTSWASTTRASTSSAYRSPDAQRPLRAGAGHRAPVPPWQPEASDKRTKLTFLWPLIASPHATAETRSDEQQTPVFTDDDLAKELAPGGRLEQMVALGSRLPVTWVIDPDLLASVAAMAGKTRSSRVSTTVPGRNQTVAKQWLTALEKVAEDGKVIALPFADPDLASIAHRGKAVSGTLSHLQKASTVAATTVETILHVKPSTDFAWPVNGAVDPPRRCGDVGRRSQRDRPQRQLPGDPRRFRTRRARRGRRRRHHRGRHLRPAVRPCSTSTRRERSPPPSRSRGSSPRPSR